MKTKPLLALVLILTYFIGYAVAQHGFTNRSDAKNTIKDSLKEGNWIEYLDKNADPTKDTNAAAYYCLTQYVHGKPSGIVRAYYKSGQLYRERTYSNGKLNGVVEV